VKPRAAAIAAVLLAALASCRGERAARPAAPAVRAPIILISIDTLRSDHLPAYGYKGVETPAIERLRRDGIVFEDAWSQVPLTLPSHASIFTGVNPPVHGVRNNIGYRLDAKAHPTLARLVKDAGYATGASVSAWVLRGHTGLNDAFDFYDDAIEPPPGSKAASQAQRPGPETISRALDWAATVRDRPFFLFVHLYEPHSPYEPPEPWRSRFAQPYDGEIAAADAAVGALLQKLDDWGIYERSAVILLSDHGEGLMDHGEQEHGILLYREALQVPLIVKLPGSARKGERVRRLAALTDVLPTIVVLAGGTVPKPIAGRDLLDASPDPRGGIYGETFYPRIHLGWSDLRSLVDGANHYIDGPEPELYDRHADAAEKTNLFSRDSPVARESKRALDRIPSDFRIPAAADAEQVKKLTALGYLSATSSAISGASLPSPMRELPTLEDSRRAFRLEATGDRRGAIAAFQKLLARNPNIFDVQYKLAETLEAEGRLREAADAYRNAISVSASMAGGASLALAKVSLKLGDLEQTRANAELALTDAPADAHELLARVALDRNELDAAEREAAGVSGSPNLDARGAVLRAEIRLRQNAPSDALKILDDALAKLDPAAREQIGNAQFLRADALARLNRYPEAENAFREEIRLFPRNSEAYARLAVLYAVEHRRVREVDALLRAMYAANPQPATSELAAKTLESIGDATGAARWRRRGGATS
jgi:arylsulfatase A-like enzyme/Flp pilus assembly protein TadD